jgi:hypothetical protein
MVTTEQVVRGIGLVSLATAIFLALKTLNDATNELKIVGDRATGWFTITRKPKNKGPAAPQRENSGMENLKPVGDAVIPDQAEQVRFSRTDCFLHKMRTVHLFQHHHCPQNMPLFNCRSAWKCVQV